MSKHAQDWNKLMSQIIVEGRTVQYSVCEGLFDHAAILCVS